MNSNEQRYHHAYVAICAYETEAGSIDLQSKDETLRDLLTDLRHYCAVDGLDFESAVQMSEIHFEEESEPAEGA